MQQNLLKNVWYQTKFCEVEGLRVNCLLGLFFKQNYLIDFLNIASPQGSLITISFEELFEEIQCRVAGRFGNFWKRKKPLVSQMRTVMLSIRYKASLQKFIMREQSKLEKPH